MYPVSTMIMMTVYYIAGSFRRDGSSRLSPENRWGNFWSVSGMWNVGAEKFMQSIKECAE